LRFLFVWDDISQTLMQSGICGLEKGMASTAYSAAWWEYFYS